MHLNVKCKTPWFQAFETCGGFYEKMATCFDHLTV